MISGQFFLNIFPRIASSFVDIVDGLLNQIFRLLFLHTITVKFVDKNHPINSRVDTFLPKLIVNICFSTKAVFQAFQEEKQLKKQKYRRKTLKKFLMQF